MPETYQIHPLPEMVDQRFAPGTLPNWCIDPTCGRYCLKALLKFHFETLTGGKVSEVKLPKATSRFGDIVGYDPYDDFPLASVLLEERYGNHPTTTAAWIQKLKTHGPVILSGTGIGHAKTVGHYILLVGGSTHHDQLYYMDPLRGNDIFKEDSSSMQGKIDGCVYAKTGIGNALAGYLPSPASVTTLPFNN